MMPERTSLISGASQKAIHLQIPLFMSELFERAKHYGKSFQIWARSVSFKQFLFGISPFDRLLQGPQHQRKRGKTLRSSETLSSLLKNQYG